MARHIAVFGAMGAEYVSIIKDAFAAIPDWQIDVWACDDDEAGRDSVIAQCEVAVISPDFVLTEGNFGALMQAPHLKVMVQPWVGIDWIDTSFLPEGLLVCNAGGHAVPMAEYVMGAILEHTLQLRVLHNDMGRGDWSRSGRNSEHSSRHSDCAGKTLGLVGYGEIAQAVARRATAFDMRVCAIANSPREATPAPLDWIGTQDDLHKLLGESDFVALTCDLNDNTQGLINAAAFAAMSPDAYLVNVARGEVIDEDALHQALAQKTIAGAALDTWYRYPSNITNAEPDPEKGGAFQGSRHDFLALDNVLLTPHSSAHTQGADAGRYYSIAETLRDYAQDKPMRRHVLTGTGDNPDGFVLP